MYVNGLVPLSSSLLDSRLLMMHIERKKKTSPAKRYKIVQSTNRVLPRPETFPCPSSTSLHQITRTQQQQSRDSCHPPSRWSIRPILSLQTLSDIHVLSLVNRLQLCKYHLDPWCTSFLHNEKTVVNALCSLHHKAPTYYVCKTQLVVSSSSIITICRAEIRISRKGGPPLLTFHEWCITWSVSCLGSRNPD